MLTLKADRFNAKQAGEYADDAEMFELAPVSLWLEDYSALKELFERDSLDGTLKGNRGKGRFS